MTFKPIQVIDGVRSAVLTVPYSNLVSVAQLSKDKSCGLLDEDSVGQTVHDLMTKLQGFHKRSAWLSVDRVRHRPIVLQTQQQLPGFRVQRGVSQ